MFRRNKIAQAVLLATATTAAAHSHAAGYLEEVVVTSTKSFESMQDVAISVQAMGEQKLKELNIANFDDYIKYLPGVNAGGRGPGQSSIFIRGMSTDSSDQTSVEIGAPVPNVALYLDEQPVSSTGRNLDVYAADLERVEVLPGPQGTLFGASSQAGTVRLITNKPVINELSGGFDASYSTTKNGEPSTSVEAVINLPVIEDKMAVRAVVYNAKEGGYIDNVYGEATFDENSDYFPNQPGNRPTTTTVNNNSLVEDDFNDTLYSGMRIGVAYSVNDDWDVLFNYMTQSLEVDGVFDHAPNSLKDHDPSARTAGDLQVQRFFRDELKDEFQQYGLTINGHIDDFDLVYAGSYLDREVNNSFDYTSYAKEGSYSAYYLCKYDGTTELYTSCGSPVQGVVGLIENTRQTHEFRFSYNGERLRTVAGIYYDDAETGVDTQFINAESIQVGFAQNGPITGSTHFKDGLRPPGTIFINDAIRTEEQIAVFGEISYDFVPDLFSATFGARAYDIESNLLGSSSFASFDVNDQFGRNYDEIGKDVAPLKEEGEVFKLTLRYTPTEDILLYYTYSEGFRPGGINRNAAATLTYETDEVVSQEIGWKMDLLDGSLRINGSAYHIAWDDMQVAILDINDFGVLTFVENAGDSEIIGVEGDISYAPTDQLTLFASFSYNDTEMVSSPTFTDGAGNGLFIEKGSQLALAPELQYNLRARYEWEVGKNSAYSQIIYSYTDDQYSSNVIDDRFKQDSYFGVDASIGMRVNDNVNVELFAENLTDERAELFINSLDADLRVTTNRPRTIGVKVGYDF
ncbi:TonB-dependent receptor [Dasania marina]|uniref:TonB-dependent receptor n=1 Tax=Dasania marina TaxID=471499 RepID=UPI0030D8D6C6|tara:strand:+ start:101286 stop:103688 length:2403 start_codon:yes stop_codon:yes gene_type:complete